MLRRMHAWSYVGRAPLIFAIGLAPHWSYVETFVIAGAAALYLCVGLERLVAK